MVDAKNPTTSPDPPAAPAPPTRPLLSGSRPTAAAQLGLGVLSALFVAMWFWINTTPVTGGQKSSAHLEVLTTTASVSVMLGGMGERMVVRCR
jgi:hypothetical protein